ncbi:DsbA family protein [Spongisporangium articulatum]|uniref:DsbA family protein n=1 Tax=Spongisporangium articulatum TaxID=3362603 RepID=A0ABW8ARC0_9ACTN
MSSPTGQNLTKKQRVQLSREQKAAKLRAEAARKRAQQRTLYVSVAVLAVLAVLIGVFVIVQNAQRDTTAASAAPPANIGSGNSFVVGNADAKVTLVAYEDFMCPYCGQFERTNRAQINAWVKDGTLKVEYRPIAFLDGSSTTKYSTRALNAAAAVENSSPTAFPKFHELLFENQPEEGSAGLSDAELAKLAGEAGADEDAVATALKNKTYEAWVAKATEDSSKAGISGTPTLLVNGTKLNGFDAATVKQAVDAAAAAAK